MSLYLHTGAELEESGRADLVVGEPGFGVGAWEAALLLDMLHSLAADHERPRLP